MPSLPAISDVTDETKVSQISGISFLFLFVLHILPDFIFRLSFIQALSQVASANNKLTPPSQATSEEAKNTEVNKISKFSFEYLAFLTYFLSFFPSYFLSFCFSLSLTLSFFFLFLFLSSSVLVSFSPLFFCNSLETFCSCFFVSCPIPRLFEALRISCRPGG